MAFCIPCSFLLIDWQRGCDPSSHVLLEGAALHPFLLQSLIYKDLCKTSHLFKTGEGLANILATQNKIKKDAKLAQVKVRMEKMIL